MAGQQVLVVGLGQFGMAMARALSANGEEVLAVDRREDRVQQAADFVHEALAMDAMDEDQLASLRPAKRDVAVCAIGDESREASIIVTAQLRLMGTPRVLARATDDVHERILRLVGATEVFNPERIFGERLAARLSSRDILDAIPLGEDLVITELRAPVSLHGRRLAELSLPARYELTVMGIRRQVGAGGKLVLPRAEEQVLEGDVLVLAGPPGAAHRLVREV